MIIKTLISSGTVRRDGSSKFINKWELSALWASWIVSNESFMDNQNVFSF
jgi:hypothetical protein